MKFIILLFALLAFDLSAEVKLPAIFSDNMIIQRNIEAPVWGWASPGEKVSVSFAGDTKSTVADKNGDWSVKLKKMVVSSKPRELTVIAKNEILLKNILIGDVWICSGQSNMEWPLSKSCKNPNEIAEQQKNNVELRLFRIPENIKLAAPAKDTKGTWETTAMAQSCLSFSGCGFFFGAKLQKDLNIPVGLIDSTWGGTPVDQWISNKAYLSFLKKDRRGSIYNGMIAPLAPFAIKGVIWYQGESNRRDPYPSYFTKLDALITGWREDFQVGDFPFYLVQIAPYDYNKKKKKKNVDSEILCNNIWASQYKAAREILNCGVVPIHDTIHGAITKIHPWDKKPVSERLASLALNKAYGKDVPFTGPDFASAKLSSGRVIVSFNNIDKGLTTNDQKSPSFFEIAGDDKVFVSAKATIKGNAVVVSAKNIKSPRYVRMGWLQTSIPNLSDKNSWPVFQFSSKEVK